MKLRNKSLKHLQFQIKIASNKKRKIISLQLQNLQKSKKIRMHQKEECILTCSFAMKC